MQNIEAPDKILVSRYAETANDLSSLRDDFPILKRNVHGKRLVYLDSAATTQKPQQVINALTDFYMTSNANVSRGIHALASEASEVYEGLRDKVAAFLGGVDRQGIVFTRNTTESINLIARSWGGAFLNPGDEILLTEMEHHSNILPWMMIARERGAEVRFAPITDDGLLDMTRFHELLSPKTRIVAVTHVSNVLGTINPVGEIIEAAHKNGSLVAVDGAQSVPHIPVDSQSMNCDFLSFSAHKMLGPTGIGVMYARPDILDTMPPFMTGGGMISEADFNSASRADIPHRFEAGTPDVGDAGTFSAAIDYLNAVGMDRIAAHERGLAVYALDKLQQFNNMHILGPDDINQRSGVITFYDPFIHPHDLSTILDFEGIAIRAGHHCAQPLMKKYGYSSTARASFYLYNTTDDVDRLIEGLKNARRYFGYG